MARALCYEAASFLTTWGVPSSRQPTYSRQSLQLHGTGLDLVRPCTLSCLV